MTISNMSQNESAAFLEAEAIRRSGNTSEAIQQVRKLSESVKEPADKAGMLYHETLWLVEAGRISEARQRFSVLQENVEDVNVSGDVQEREMLYALNVMVRFVEAKLLIEEGNKPAALNILMELSDQSDVVFTSSSFEPIKNEVTLLIGVLLVDEGNYLEARPYLERAGTIPGWEGLANFYMARCYFELSELDKAKSSLVEALKFELNSKWAAWAHFLLGRVCYARSDFSDARNEFVTSLKFADTEFSSTHKVFEWLDAANQALNSRQSPETSHKPN